MFYRLKYTYTIGSVLLCTFQVVVAEVLAGGRQLVAHQVGEYLFQLQEEALAWHVAIGVHVEGQP